MESIKSASVFGLGKLGACIAATLARRGFEVVGIDIDPDKVRQNKTNPTRPQSDSGQELRVVILRGMAYAPHHFS